jgi:serine phosphatase RsbU (regulator of sigma subunit)
MLVLKRAYIQFIPVTRLSAEEICNKIVETMRRFADGIPQRDDVTLVIVKFLPPVKAS